jgi:hypothetical protein
VYFCVIRSESMLLTSLHYGIDLAMLHLGQGQFFLRNLNLDMIQHSSSSSKGVHHSWKVDSWPCFQSQD